MFLTEILAHLVGQSKGSRWIILKALHSYSGGALSNIVSNTGYPEWGFRGIPQSLRATTMIDVDRIALTSTLCILRYWEQC
jgi:hypothetical protein